MPVAATSKELVIFEVIANRTYRHLFFAQVIALLGTGLATVALGLLADDLAGGNAGAVPGTALAMTQIGEVYILIFFIQSASAGFTSTFQATIPDIPSDEREYTRALSLSRLHTTWAVLQLSQTDVALALAAYGSGSMLAALLLPRILDKVSNRPIMLGAAAALTALLAALAAIRLTVPDDGLWGFLLAGWLGARAGQAAAFAGMAAIAACGTVLGALVWPQHDPNRYRIATRILRPTTRTCARRIAQMHTGIHS